MEYGEKAREEVRRYYSEVLQESGDLSTVACQRGFMTTPSCAASVWRVPCMSKTFDACLLRAA